MSEPDERDLAEVERALSVLGGRHPEQVRAERLAAEAAAKRKLEHESAARADRRVAMRKRALALVAACAVAACAVIVWRVFATRARADAAIAPSVARYVALGFDALPRSSFAAQDRVETSTIAGDCYAFVATNSAPLRIERPIGTAGAPGEALVCTCAAEKITVSAPGAIVRALHIAGASLGGSRAAMFRFGDRAPTIIAGDDACQDDMLAAFARDARYPKQDADGVWLASHHAFARAGFETVASAPPKRAYAFAPSRASRCYVAATTGDDALTLWSIDQATQKPIENAKTALAWCVEKESTFVVERVAPPSHAPGTITIASAPSARVAGMLGLREIARADDVAVTAWSRDEERGALAMDTLRASVVPDPVAAGCESFDASRAANARVLVFSSATSDTFSSTDLDVRCAPTLGAPESLCVQPRALAWRAPPNATCAVAYGPLPYWMSVMESSHDTSVEALDAELALVTFARKLAARGFFPGVIEGVTEKPTSVEILGRSGDDAIVAIGLWPTPPFIHPYSDGAAWTLADDPPVVAIHGGESVTLPVRVANAIAIDKRRTVVFRHSQSHAIH
jgi:hypothetical protein